MRVRHLHRNLVLTMDHPARSWPDNIGYNAGESREGGLPGLVLGAISRNPYGTPAGWTVHAALRVGLMRTIVAMHPRYDQSNFVRHLELSTKTRVRLPPRSPRLFFPRRAVGDGYALGLSYMQDS